MSMSDRLSAFPLLTGLSQTHIAVLSGAAQEVTFAAGDRLFTEGTPARGCWLVQRGCVAIDAGIPGRGPVVVQTVGPGEVVGWSWLVDPPRWHFGAVAVAPTVAIELDTDQLRAFAEHDPTFGYPVAVAMLAMVLDRLQTTRARLLDLYRNPAETPMSPL
ncbi:Crp/Fnr family transcriptional regulator [Kutzneria sp. CA-103260]|uniref:Crp/Fnr family transcriptional regulator n=1 Tax=Kutzneria sp. CA-103260 TaxID=2802641 RepID=UPI001BA73E73|nr:Crp/Fnr family transcriptional regulator [Kutzneria sp. CA-103260]QUQ64062.1 cyclic nucleotide-binding domain-containing protein [Kutzneria sp. CA-103260]